MTKNEIIEIIFESIDEINQEYDVKLPKELSTKLFGGECELDSLGLVSLIVSIEENINNSCSFSISIADEKAMSQKYSPFRSVDTLANYVMGLVNEEK